MSDTALLPDAARFALWFTAWVAGACSLDEVRDAVVGDDAAHDVAGLDDEPEAVPLIMALGRLRRGATGAGLALPVPGDPLGLAGPADFTLQALDAGEAVVLDGRDLGLVPVRAGAGVTWVCVPAVSHRQVPDRTEADQALRRALVEAATEMSALDVARWRPEAADALMSVRRAADLPLPPGTEGRVVRLVSLAARCRSIVEVALEDDGGAQSSHEIEARRNALLPLDHAARRALVAACTPVPDR